MNQKDCLKCMYYQFFLEVVHTIESDYPDNLKLVEIKRLMCDMGEKK